MNTYHLDVITGYGGASGRVEYRVKADGFEINEAGYYSFWTKTTFVWGSKFFKEVMRSTETVGVFPINRTVIAKIEYGEVKKG